MTILHPDIPESDSKMSAAGIELLHSYLTGVDSSLVFFVAAGASMTGNTGMPGTPKLIFQLFLDSLIFSKHFDHEINGYKEFLEKINPQLSFEITVNDYWQICRSATSSIYPAFGDLEKQRAVNRVHTFLAQSLQ